jgi:hypothetical protein
MLRGDVSSKTDKRLRLCLWPDGQRCSLDVCEWKDVRLICAAKLGEVDEASPLVGSWRWTVWPGLVISEDRGNPRAISSYNLEDMLVLKNLVLDCEVASDGSNNRATLGPASPQISSAADLTLEDRGSKPNLARQASSKVKPTFPFFLSRLEMALQRVHFNGVSRSDAAMGIGDPGFSRNRP